LEGSQARNPKAACKHEGEKEGVEGRKGDTVTQLCALPLHVGDVFPGFKKGNSAGKGEKQQF